MTETPTRWRLVPETATEAEIEAIADRICDDTDIVDYMGWPGAVRVARSARTAMLSASPSPGDEMVEQMAAVLWAITRATPEQFAHADEWARRVYLSNARAILAMLTRGN